MGEQRGGSHKAARRAKRPRYSPGRLRLRSRIDALLDQPWPLRLPLWIERGRLAAGLEVRG